MQRMVNLYLVRHGQASLGAANYDQLSPTGHLQGERLGAYWRSIGQHFDAIYTGNLRRHQQTLAAISQGAQTDWLSQAATLAALREYDADALLRAAKLSPDALPDISDSASIRHHFGALCKALTLWIDGHTTPQGMPSWQSFQAELLGALQHMREQHAGKNVLVVSSGGPICTVVAHAVGAPAHAMIGLNMQLHNSALSELHATHKRTTLRCFNALPHLAGPAQQQYITAA